MKTIYLLYNQSKNWSRAEELISKLVINPLPNDKSLILSRLKAFADDKINVT